MVPLLLPVLELVLLLLQALPMWVMGCPHQQLDSDSSCLWQLQDDATGAVDLGAVDLGAVDLRAVDLGAVDPGAALPPEECDRPDLHAGCDAGAPHSKLHPWLRQEAHLGEWEQPSTWVAWVGLPAGEEVGGHPCLGWAGLPCWIWWSCHRTETGAASTQGRVGRRQTGPAACPQGTTRPPVSQQ